MKPYLFALLLAAGPALAESPAYPTDKPETKTEPKAEPKAQPKADTKTDPAMPAMKSARPSKSAQLKLDMRELWAEHVSWTRAYVVSAVGGIEDRDAVGNRLMRNQEDLGAAIQAYYGKPAADRMATLLKDHINIAIDVVDAAKANKKDDLDAAQKRWSANAGDIAEFLADANPNWSEGELKPMLQKHLDLLTNVVNARIKGDWEADIEASDDGMEHMIHFADTLADGIVRQFPEKFTAGA